ncbi:hypothetical protein IGI04_034088 [Brassica rapa subsp. trilocularis]|uniref:Uncharacterized protein n=2 Tax=Brassica TaxID=3705 RepID=A0ABQ7XD73_BRANA|nr:hypothetical protein IGI04_034088 [Brassica rapa subsp. trilocularis]KAH0853061.1 hypothetical protein HID58_090727 [Brassica napus]KAH0909358.1 hypothetical protein HID58_032679 [Brassica napus]
MGIGLFLSVLSIAAAAVVATVRLQLARDAVSMNIFWQGPQYMLMGIAERFFYLSLLILTLVAYFTTADGKEGWIPDDLDKGHLDYFFWLLVVLGLVNIPVHVFFSVKYTQKKAAV